VGHPVAQHPVRRQVAVGSRSRAVVEVVTVSLLAGVRSLLETPILDVRKWGKLPTIPCDAVLSTSRTACPPIATLKLALGWCTSSSMARRLATGLRSRVSMHSILRGVPTTCVRSRRSASRC